jgi:hypothetical protein
MCWFTSKRLTPIGVSVEMTYPKTHNLLIIGVDTVSIAKSAKEAGYKIYVADYFGDIDLRPLCSGYETTIKQKIGISCGKIRSDFKPERFLKMTKSLIQKYKIEGILLSSGLDDSSDILYDLNNLIPFLGNHPKVFERIREKQEFFKELRHLGIKHPETTIVKNLSEAESAADEMNYPLILKPIRGFGGSDIRIAWNIEEFRRSFSEISLHSEKLLVQRFINGIQASLSFLATDKESRILTLNEQLLGVPYLFQQEPFGYCGNIVPLHVSKSIFKKCKSIAEKIAYHFNLKGSNGIDLIISEEGVPHVVEVNPRFQGTLEGVNKVLGINLVQAHVDACLHGSLPSVKERTSIFCTRLILYAPNRVIAPNLSVFNEVRDVPLPGTIIEKGEPLCSVLTEGKTRELSLHKAKKITESIYGNLHLA